MAVIHALGTHDGRIGSSRLRGDRLIGISLTGDAELAHRAAEFENDGVKIVGLIRR